MILRSKILLAIEFLILFVALPLLLLLRKPSIPPIPLLWALCAYALTALLRDSTFSRSELWNPGPFRSQLVSILSLFLVGVVLLAWLVQHFAPTLLFSFVRAHPVIWALVMVLYPVLSVYPQGVIYRVFVMHRYRELFSLTDFQKKWALILLSAVAFSIMHVLFRNPIAVALTFAGGIFFAWRQLRTRSLFVSSFEHALYGCFLFTVGLGQFFYARFV